VGDGAAERGLRGGLRIDVDELRSSVASAKASMRAWSTSDPVGDADFLPMRARMSSRLAKRENAGFTASFDMLGEAARTFPDAERYFASYEEAIRAVGKVAERGHSISVKLSALHPRYEVAQYDRCVPSLIEQVEALAIAGQGKGHRLHHRRRGERAARDEPRHHRGGRRPALAEGLGRARHGVQAYGKRARPTIAWADALGAKTGRRIAVRLVKGAYWDSEIKRTQEQGLADYPLFTRKAATDVSYLACAKDMLAAKNIFRPSPPTMR
jgi:RHH-type proline utilization regulon transcriptional repressor/proline dehydrogenase/delta 1-pyrroline-5-carboxylate dehydrogenase